VPYGWAQNSVCLTLIWFVEVHVCHANYAAAYSRSPDTLIFGEAKKSVELPAHEMEQTSLPDWFRRHKVPLMRGGLSEYFFFRFPYLSRPTVRHGSTQIGSPNSGNVKPYRKISLLMNWPGLGLFEISGAKKTKLLKRQDILPIINSRYLAACKLSLSRLVH